MVFFKKIGNIRAAVLVRTLCIPSSLAIAIIVEHKNLDFEYISVIPFATLVAFLSRLGFDKRYFRLIGRGKYPGFLLLSGLVSGFVISSAYSNKLTIILTTLLIIVTQYLSQYYKAKSSDLKASLIDHQAIGSVLVISLMVSEVFTLAVNSILFIIFLVKASIIATWSNFRILKLVNLTSVINGSIPFVLQNFVIYGISETASIARSPVELRITERLISLILLPSSFLLPFLQKLTLSLGVMETVRITKLYRIIGVVSATLVSAILFDTLGKSLSSIDILELLLLGITFIAGLCFPFPYIADQHGRGNLLIKTQLCILFLSLGVAILAPHVLILVYASNLLVTRILLGNSFTYVDKP